MLLLVAAAAAVVLLQSQTASKARTMEKDDFSYFFLLLLLATGYMHFYPKGSNVLFPGALPLACAGVGGYTRYIEVPNVSSDILEKHNFSTDSVAGGC